MFNHPLHEEIQKFFLVSNLKHSTSALPLFPHPQPRGSQLGPVPGRPVIRGVVLAIVQGAVLIQGAGDDQAKFVPCEEARGAVRRLAHNQSSSRHNQTQAGGKELLWQGVLNKLCPCCQSTNVGNV